MQPLLEIVDAKYLHDYVIWVKFSNNEQFELDLSPMLQGDKIGVFEPLKRLTFFRDFHIDYTLCWKNGIDVAPEYLYFLAHKDSQQYRALFQEWGYIK